MPRDRFKVQQIYYDESSKGMLDAGFIPLNNSLNPRPDWYEFFVIFQFLKTHELQNDCWYGFLSPKFKQKTGLTSDNLYEFLEAADQDNHDVAITSPGWDQICYFRNTFEQGEYVHPGLIDLTQEFCSRQKIDLDIRGVVSHSQNSVFSNFIVAKPNYWKKWLMLAQAFFAIVEDNSSNFSSKTNTLTTYHTANRLAPMKTFIQERFPSMLLSSSEFFVANLDLSTHLPINHKLFNIEAGLRQKLLACDLFKRQYLDTSKPEFINSYYQMRNQISIKQNPFA